MDISVKCANGTEIKIEEDDLYLRVIVGQKTWFWNRGTGEFDGTAVKLEGLYVSCERREILNAS